MVTSRRAARLWPLLMTALICAPLAAAQEPEGSDEAQRDEAAAEPVGETRYFGYWRYIYSHQQPFPLNAAGDERGLGWYLDQRLTAGIGQQLSDTLAFGAELELLYGQVAGDHDHVAADLRPDARTTLRGWDLKEAEMRQLWLSWRTPWFRLKAGQMGSHWGLGVLANDGRPTPGRLGFQEHGDLSDRVLLATRPLASWFPEGWAGRLVTAIGGGLVYRDENTSLRDGDLGGEAILSLFYPGDQLWLGLYVAGRFAEDDAGTRLDVVALDLHGRWGPADGRPGPYAAAELIYLTGKTDRVITAEQLDGLNLSAFGAVARAGWRFDLWGLQPELELGYASGDPDPHDETITAFSFDPDYAVGLVLFDHVLRGVTAMAAQESADPDRVAVPLPGTDQLASRGRVSNAVYLYPSLRLRPLEQLSIVAAFLYAWSAVEFSQSYQTFRSGGVPTNPYGLSDAGRDLGFELDLGADWAQPLWRDLRLVVGVQAGWFFPGRAFERPDGTRPGIVARLVSRAKVAW